MTTPTYRILLVEDNEVNQEVFQEMLDALGYGVRVAGHGKEALNALIGDDGLDLVLMDCQMPVMDGYTASAKIRMLEKSQGDAHIPIIALTAHAMDGERDRCISAGMDDYLTKPVRSASLHEMLQKWLAPTQAPEAAPEAVSQEKKEAFSVNREAMETMRQEVGGKVGRILSKYLDALAGRVGKIRSGVEEGDMEQVRSAAHTLKGSSGVVCAERLTVLCREMEALTTVEQKQQALLVLVKIDAEAAVMRPILEEMIAAEQ